MPTPSLAKDRSPSLWRNISFMLMWTSVAASGFGDRMIQLAAEPMLGVELEGASAAQIQAGIMFWFFLPYMLLTLVGGWLADRLPRKWVMLACDEGRALVLLAGFLMARQMSAERSDVPEDHQWKVYLVIALTGCFAALFNPAKQSTVPQIVPKRDLQGANAIIGAISLIASLLGVAAGGPIIDAYGIAPGILTGFLLFAISGMFFAFMRIEHRVPTGPRPSLVAQVVQGGGYMWRHGSVRVFVLLNILFWAVAYVVNAAISALNRHYYGIPAEQYLSHKTTMLALFGVGMVGGCLYVIWHKTRREADIVAMASLAAAGVMVLLMAVVHVYWVGLALALLGGFFGGIGLVCIETMTQSITPNYIRGRMFGLRAQLNTVIGVGVNLAIWMLPEEHADRLMIPSLLLTGGVLLVVSLWTLFVQLTRGPQPSRALNFMWRVCRIYTLVWHRVRWIGKGNVPSAGPVILASNHTTALDPFLIQAGVPRTIRWVMTTPFRFRILEPMWKRMQPIALDPGTGNIGNLKQVIARLKQNEIVGLFPEGGLQREKRELQPFRPGIGLIAQRSGATIVPVWISGTPRVRFMLWHLLRPSRSVVIYGQPYVPDPQASREEVAADLRRRMLDLSRQSAFGEMECPQCETDLNEAFGHGTNICPECGWLVWEQSAVDGEGKGQNP